jgi:hypothetical protein
MITLAVADALRPGGGFTATFFEQPAAIMQAAPTVAHSSLFTWCFLQEKFPGLQPTDWQPSEDGELKLATAR